MFQYLDGHARVAELEQLERRRQVELDLVHAGRDVIRQVRVVLFVRAGIRHGRRQEIQVDRGLSALRRKHRTINNKRRTIAM